MFRKILATSDQRTIILIKLFTRLAAIPLIMIMLVALATTKADILNSEGFWSMLHASRTDWSMLLGSVFLLIKGAGRWSIEYKLQKRLIVKGN